MKKIVFWIGSGLHILCFLFTLLSFGNYPYSGVGMGIAFRFWFYSFLISLPVFAFYLINGVILLVEGIRYYNKRRIFWSVLKMLAVVIGIPLWLFFGSSVGVVEFIIWNAYSFLLFIMQIGLHFLIHTEEI